ncbi:KOW domain-containing RNA-binding protein [Ruminococcaceae bacterium OttesenSCG-928-L11]|nr:KOW domain-containing RNA-binding protein [Ruminococcaceae bacterium OttesenSCG-928-L11]
METGRVVRSIAGHDRDRFYVVVDAGDGKVYIADGRLRKLAKPKAKNPLHIRPTSNAIDLENCKTDKKLRELLKPYNDRAQAAEPQRGR